MLDWFCKVFFYKKLKNLDKESEKGNYSYLCYAAGKYDVKIIGGKKVILWEEPARNSRKKDVFIPPINRSEIAVVHLATPS